jgi:hypothetical protein
MIDEVLVRAGGALHPVLFMKYTRAVIAKMAAAKGNLFHEQTQTV